MSLGISVMLGMMSDNEETVNAIKSSIGKHITNVKINENSVLCFLFTDNTELFVFDDGQTCCESRYMVTDDNLHEYIGATLQGFALKNAPNMEDEWGEHEVQFLDVNTSVGTFQLASHNEHNGYYGGFLIRAKLSLTDKDDEN